MQSTFTLSTERVPVGNNSTFRQKKNTSRYTVCPKKSSVKQYGKPVGLCEIDGSGDGGIDGINDGTIDATADGTNDGANDGVSVAGGKTNSTSKYNPFVSKALTFVEMLVAVTFSLKRKTPVQLFCFL